MKTMTQVLGTTVLALSAALTQAATINFDSDGNGNTLSAGDVVNGSTYAADGISFSTDAFVKGSTTKRANLMIFDSANPTGGDTDLRTPGGHSTNTIAQGNVLIISEDNDSNDPDDHVNGGTIFIDFAGEYGVKSIGLLDIEHSGTHVSLFDIHNNLIVKKNAQGIADNSWQELIFNQRNVARMEVFFNTSGAITNLEYVAPPSTSVSEPGTLALFALGMMGIISARRRVAS